MRQRTRARVETSQLYLNGLSKKKKSYIVWLIHRHISDYRETEVYGNAIATQVEFLTLKHNNLPFTCQLEIYRGRALTLSESQIKRAVVAILGTEDTDTDTDLDGGDDDDNHQNAVSDDDDNISLT